MSAALTGLYSPVEVIDMEPGSAEALSEARRVLDECAGLSEVAALALAGENLSVEGRMAAGIVLDGVRGGLGIASCLVGR